MIEHLYELAETLRTAKLRTMVTALSVAWGIFMLVILLGAGSGIQNGAEHEFRDDATNSLWVYRGTTSIPFEGHEIGRPVRIDDDDYEAMKREIDGVERITGRYYIQGQFTVSYRGTVSSFDVRACHPDHRFIENTAIIDGRFINPLDVHLEGQYRLPLPADAAVYAMRIELDGRMIEGVIREKSGKLLT